MKSSEKIRIAFTYLRESVDMLDIKENMIQMDAGTIWGDIKSGTLSTVKTAAMMKHAREMQSELETLQEHIEEIDREIRQIYAEEQIRMDTRLKR